MGSSLMAVHSAKLSLVGSTLPLQRFLTYRLSRLNAKLNRQAVATLKKTCDLKLPEWRLISLLATYGERNGRWIGDTAEIDPGLLSRTFRSLELRNLISARRDEEDRREVYFALTRKGRQLYEKTHPNMQARQQALFAALDAHEQSAIFKIIDKLEIAADARDGSRQSR
ncbi:DNA-binding MarR family transcriptional regulator [Bradyrhizobium sp. AZCC 1719]|uniref:MarR family winged helix-turn-helix transcriptional regulator n=1 Tax=Bradyrhizobium sp. AZCC 1719 TaxID=3117028 RepID=UPI002FEF37D3